MNIKVLVGFTILNLFSTANGLVLPNLPHKFHEISTMSLILNCAEETNGDLTSECYKCFTDAFDALHHHDENHQGPVKCFEKYFVKV